MTTVHIVVEGQTDQRLLAQLLRDLEARIQFHVAGGKHAAHSLARTLQIKYGEPVALVLDADTTDDRMALEEQTTYESYLSFTAKGVPFIVILFRPDLEEIFFESPQVLAELSGKTLKENDIFLGKAAPKPYLKVLGIEWAQLLETLKEQHVQALRKVGVIAKLRDFVHGVIHFSAA